MKNLTAILTTLALAGSLAFDSNALAQEPEPKVYQYKTGARLGVTEDQRFDFTEPITFEKGGERTILFYDNWDRGNDLFLISHDNPLLGRGTVISVWGYDFNRDGKIDLVSISRAYRNPYSHSGESVPSLEEGSIWFYRGPVPLGDMLKLHDRMGSDINLGHAKGSPDCPYVKFKGRTIPEQEVGVTTYNTHGADGTFVSNDSPKIKEVFAIMDAMYADLFPTFKGNPKKMGKAAKKVLAMGQKYQQGIQTLLSVPPSGEFGEE